MRRRILDSPWPYFVGAALLLLVALATQFEIRLPSRPVGSVAEISQLRERVHLNVVFILIDTLRADRLGAYGYERPTTAHIDALAHHGVLFRNVMAQSSWTKTSIASLWTATYPANNGILRFNHVLPEEAVLPAELFREAGFRTAGIWRNGWVAPNFGFAQGFEFYVNPKPGRAMRRIQGGHPSGKTLPGTDEDLVTSAFEFIDSFGRERFFLYLHFMDLHQYVYEESSALFGTSYSDVYDQALHWTDRLVGVVLARIEAIDQLQNTVVVIASDHGEAFLEHGIEGHAKNLYSEVVNVPFVIGLPFRLDPGIVVDGRAENVDIWPTVLDLVGLPPLQGSDGRSLLPDVLAAVEAAGTRIEERLAIAHLDRRWGSTTETDPMISVTDQNLRLVWRVNRPEESLLFDLEADLGEHANLYGAEDETSQRLVGVARDYLENGQTPWGAEAVEVELDALRLNQLRALGYVIR